MPRTPIVPSEEVLETAITEQRRVYDWLSTGYDQAKIKVLTFFGGGLGVLTFLYSSGDTFIPHELYGKVFYFIGLGLMIFGLSTLVTAVQRRHWEFPTETRDLKALQYETKRDYLEYIRDRYVACYELNVKAYDDKHKLLDIAFYPLVFGAIILVVLKIFGR
jgi:hypothetical protein